MGVSGKKYNGVGRLKSLVLGMDDVDIDKVAVNVSTVIDKVETCVKKNDFFRCYGLLWNSVRTWRKSEHIHFYSGT